MSRAWLHYAAPYDMERLVLRHLGGVGEDGAQTIGSELRIAREHLFLGPASSKETEQEIDGEPSAAYDWLTCNNFGVGRDVVLPGHSISLSHVAGI